MSTIDLHKKPEPQQIYATIRKESKYRHQQKRDGKGKAIPFEVSIRMDIDPFWPVKGGVGDNYTLYDVDLYVKYEDKFKKLPLHNKPE